MFYILQKNSKDRASLFFETQMVKRKLDGLGLLNKYVSQELSCFDDKKQFNSVAFESYKGGVPIGTIQFVEKWLDLFHNIKSMNPIEVPIYLRTDEFLKRDYKIVSANELPLDGRYFIKDVSILKGPLLIGDDNIKDRIKSPESIRNIKKINRFDNYVYLDNSHLYQVSEIVDIKSEYRAYVIDRNIEAIINYNGDPLVLPDVNLIKKAMYIFSQYEDCPNSYTIDLMVNDRGTSIIEIHNFCSVGLYTTLWGNNLLSAYKDGIDYILDYNCTVEK